jgi:hypothetical protein
MFENALTAVGKFTPVALVLSSNKARRYTQLSNNSALSKLLHLDVASISAVAFQCNNNPGERSVANLLPSERNPSTDCTDF